MVEKIGAFVASLMKMANLLGFQRQDILSCKTKMFGNHLPRLSKSYLDSKIHKNLN